MASKFRNLIASKVRQTQMMAAGSLEKRPSCSLQELEVKMRLTASPNPRLPFRINLNFPSDENHTKKITDHSNSFDQFYYSSTFASMSKNSSNGGRTLEICIKNLVKSWKYNTKVILKKTVFTFFI